MRARLSQAVAVADEALVALERFHGYTGQWIDGLRAKLYAITKESR